ncbi:uncharacterized protein C8Q71DRAFT_162192 [Rhodofomes roseus]|uniref:DUF6534 domain-containing protein n=1 Tax=Rhodofomes roseus TaxID=34475 RepID=A0ABQ8K9V7_9APHY|nr:uncharacterized protein C8Q71DRAFT_162192 [Rhodofomes roseus]KAH9834135.1 hypothetical protein C8Q71DRAFT_162192 [Rhodofomes roseus]
MTTSSPSVELTYQVLTPYFIGGVCVAFLYGVTTGQMIFYWNRGGRDGKVFRFLVFMLWLLDGAHYVLVPCSFYVLLVENLHDSSAWINEESSSYFFNTWSYQGIFVVTGLTDIGVKSIFTYRIWKLSNSAMIGGALVVFNLTVLVLSIVSAFTYDCIGAHALPSCFSNVPAHGHINTSIGTAIAMLACMAASDIATFVLLCVFLWRRRTGFARTIRLLILYSIEVGMLTSVASAASLTTFLVVGYSSALFIAIFWVVPKLSINSLLALLNARHHIRHEAGLVVEPSALRDTGVAVNDTLRFEVTRSRIWTRTRQTPQLIITVETEVELDRESDVDAFHSSDDGVGIASATIAEKNSVTH